LASSTQASTPLWLKVLVIAMGLVLVTGFVVIATEVVRRISTSNVSRPPAGTGFAERIPLPSGAKVLSMTAVADRLAVHVETQDGLSSAYIVDPRTGQLLGTVAFPPGTR
jgi:hypothetical protein